MGQAPQTCPRCVRACRLVLPRPGAGDHCQCDHRMSPMSLRGRRRDLRLDIDARVSLAFDEAGRCKRGGQCGKSRASGWCQIAGVLDSRCSWCGRFRCQRCPPVHSGVNVRENATTSARHGQPLRDCACHMGSVDDAQQEMRAGADFASVLPTREPRVPLSNAVSLHARPDCRKRRRWDTAGPEDGAQGNESSDPPARDRLRVRTSFPLFRCLSPAR
jgi:hypothetical protein